MFRIIKYQVSREKAKLLRKGETTATAKVLLEKPGKIFLQTSTYQNIRKFRN